MSQPSRRIVRHLYLMMTLCMGLLVLAFPPLCEAHELQPTVVDIVVQADGQAELSLTANLEALIAGIGAEHDTTEAAPQAEAYDALRALPPEALQAELEKFAGAGFDDIVLSFNGAPLPMSGLRAEVPVAEDLGLPRQSVIRLDTRLPSTGGTLLWSFPDRFGNSVLRLYRAGEAQPVHAAFVPAGQSESVSLDESFVTEDPGTSFWTYMRIGFDHILPKGLDHVLFIIGLFLLNPAWRPLLVQVTTFTLAHSVTLALGLLGLVTVPGSIVEPLIAASIAFVALENIFTRKLHRWRIVVVFLFGLLHGLGFAGVLSAYAASGSQFFKSLLGFNLGVELGQIAVVAICYVTVGLWFGQKHWYHSRIVVPASLCIAAVAVFWVVERVGLLG